MQLLSENRTLEFILAALTKVDTLDSEVCGKLLHGVFVFASFKISVKQFKVMLGLTRTKDGKRVRNCPTLAQPLTQPVLRLSANSMRVGFARLECFCGDLWLSL